MALLRTLRLYDDALVVVTSDHGEEFGEHGQMGWHSHTLYDELLHVPLLVKLPGSRRAGTTIEETVRGIDVAPTVLATLGKTLPSGFEGHDVLGFWPSPAGAAEVWSSRDVTTPAGSSPCARPTGSSSTGGSTICGTIPASEAMSPAPSPR